MEKIQKVQKSIGLSEPMWAWVEAQAEKENRSQANWIETVLQKMKEEQEDGQEKKPKV